MTPLEQARLEQAYVERVTFDMAVSWLAQGLAVQVRFLSNWWPTRLTAERRVEWFVSSQHRWLNSEYALNRPGTCFRLQEEEERDPYTRTYRVNPDWRP